MTAKATPVSTDRATDWATILVLLGAGYCVSLQVGRMPAALPELMRAFDVGIVTAGWLVSVVTGVAAVMGIAAGTFTARLGARQVVIGGLVVSAVGALVGAFVSNATLMLTARLLEGLGFIAVGVAVPPLLLSFSRVSEQPFVMSVWGTYYPVGMGVMLAITPLLLDVLGWRGAWLANSAIVAVWALIAMQRIPQLPGTAPDDRALLSTIRSDAAALAALGQPLWLAAAFAAYACQFLSVMTFLPVLLTETAKFTPVAAGLFTACVVLLNGAGNILGAMAVRRGVAIATVFSVACVVMALGALLVFSNAPPTLARLVGVAAFSLFGGAFPAAAFALIAGFKLPARVRPGAVGALIQGAAIGQFVGPPLLAAVVKAGGSWAWAPAFTVICALACIIAGRRAAQE